VGRGRGSVGVRGRPAGQGKLRRYGTANRLKRLGTLTYRGQGCHDPLAFRRDIGSFFRSLGRSLGDEPFPYMWVPEWHKSGHGLHGHFAVGRFVKRSLIERAWGHGFVHITLLGHLPVGSGRFEESRVAARYLAKYIGKDFDEQRVPGLHRYDVARRFEPLSEQLVGWSVENVLAQASERMGFGPSVRWYSDQELGWHGPPAVWASWTR
jgi:hypothetical protein